MDISTNIRRFRIQNKMEQSELAELLHISNKTVSSWERGRTEPRMGMIEAMCNIFNCSKTELIDGSPANAVDNVDIEVLTSIYQSLNDEGRDDLLKYARYLASRSEYIKSRISKVV